MLIDSNNNKETYHMFSQLLLAVLLALWGLDGLFSLGVNVKVLYVLAVATAVFIILETWGILNWRVRRG